MAKKSDRIKAKKEAAKVETKVKKAKTPSDPKAFSVKVFDIKGKNVGEFPLDKSLFSGEVNKSALYQAVLMYNSNMRQGNASTKTRGDVSGGGKKPWRQKGTGRARAGSTRSPLWRGGGKIFGPHPRDYHYSIPKKVKKLAFLSSMNLKLNEDRVMGLDSLKLDEPKTKHLRSVVGALKLGGKVLFVVDRVDENLSRASGNMQEVTVRNLHDVSTMDVLKSDVMVIAKPALEKLHERCA
ncbi:MAG: 50S ribosomal protein L4 [Candidatus Omnitrophica bacterium]|nr:50S ribosomal protein L4 [Candidatus Omnitrophota bacterium]